MRTALFLRYTTVFACILCVADADAAERIIRPRRVNRPAPTHMPASAQIIVPPDSVPPEPTATYQEDPGNPPPAPVKNPIPKNPLPRRGWGWTADKELELQSEFAARGPEPDPEKESREEAPAVEEKIIETEVKKQQEVSAPQITAPAAPPLVPGETPYEQYLKITGDIQTAERSAVKPLQSAEEPAIEEPAEENVETPEEVPEEKIPEEPAAASPPPTPSEVEAYRQKLEFRLLERYNNLPEHAGEVARVTVVLSKPLQPSMDGTRLKAEFDQLVYDTWGRRIPALEKEYFVVTFSSGGVRQVRSDPSIRVGLNLERTYSEPGPDSDIGEKIKTLPSDHAFRAAPSVEVPAAKMPDWWRPEFADDGY